MLTNTSSHIQEFLSFILFLLYSFTANGFCAKKQSMSRHQGPITTLDVGQPCRRAPRRNITLLVPVCRMMMLEQLLLTAGLPSPVPHQPQCWEWGTWKLPHEPGPSLLCSLTGQQHLPAHRFLNPLVLHDGLMLQLLL